MIFENSATFALDELELGGTNSMKHLIGTGDGEPVNLLARPIPYAYEEKVGAVLRDLSKLVHLYLLAPFGQIRQYFFKMTLVFGSAVIFLGSAQ